MNVKKTKLCISFAILCFFALVFLVSLIYDIYVPSHVSLLYRNMPPSLSHWFGTDEVGRDVFVRTISGLKTSVSIATVVAIIDLCIGTLWGTWAAFSTPLTEKILIRISDLTYSLPYLLIVIAILFLLGPSSFSIIIAMASLAWVPIARMAHMLVKIALQKEYVLAAKALGAPPFHIFFSHILPNIRHPLCASGMIAIPNAVFMEALLGFLGFNNASGHVSLGTMISEAMDCFQFFPWRLFFPAVSLSLLMIAISFLADGLQTHYHRRQE